MKTIQITSQKQLKELLIKGKVILKSKDTSATGELKIGAYGEYQVHTRDIELGEIYWSYAFKYLKEWFVIVE